MTSSTSTAWLCSPSLSGKGSLFERLPEARRFDRTEVTPFVCGIVVHVLLPSRSQASAGMR